MINKIISKKAIYYVSTIIVALLVGIMGGVVDILQTDAVVKTAQSLGYPLYFFVLLGIFKILGAVALLLPKKFDRLRDIAYTGFAFDFIFASFSHYSVGDGFMKIIVPLIFLALLALSYSLKNRI